MTRDELVRARGAAWHRLSGLLRAGETARGLKRLKPAEVREMSELYRSLAGDLMRVRRDKLGADLERHLDQLASRAHNLIYAGTDVGNRFRAIDLLADFAPAVRRNVRFVALASALFYLPGALAGLAAYADESYALAVMTEAQLESYEEMYQKRDPSGRDAGASASMTGFYVMNNVGIAFRCFATGLLYGLGSMFFLLFNGLHFGVVIGHLTRSGLADNILSFVITHGAFELTAIVLSGAAGLQMGFALVSTHGRTRLGNLQAHGLELLRQIVGAAALLFIAAGLEAWFSPSALPVETKYAVGAICWAGVTLFLVLAGRERPVPEDVIALHRDTARRLGRVEPEEAVA